MIKSQRKGAYLEIIIPDKWHQNTIEDILKNHYKMPKRMMHLWRMNKDVFINGETVAWNVALNQKDKLLLPIFKEEPTSIPATFIDLTILYEDEHLIIVNKPANIDTHPSHPNQEDTLLNAVAFYLLTQGESGQLQHIHRLDKDTTGAIIFAKNAFTATLLNRMLEERAIKRTYKALVHGKFHRKKGRIEANIGRDRHHATRRRVSPTGQRAVTNFEVLQFSPKTNLSLIQCQLETGRTHQIRVHLSHEGHPLAGDTLYGGEPIFPRQALHAYKVTFQHPITEETIDVEAPFIDHPVIFPS